MTDAARMTVALIAAGGRAQAVRPLLEVLPFPTGGISRGEYSIRIRKTAWFVGHHSGATAPGPNWPPRPAVPGQRHATAEGTR